MLGVLVQALDSDQHRNKYLDKIICGLNQVESPDSSITLRPRLDLKKLLPGKVVASNLHDDDFPCRVPRTSTNP